MKTIKLRFVKLREQAKVPFYGTEFSAGADLCACMEQPIEILPGRTEFIKTGLAVEIPVGYVGLVYARSGLACKKGMAPANKVGVIDSDYRGEVVIALHNHSEQKAMIKPGERVAQMVITPYVYAEYEEAEKLDETGRGQGGFGSTGRL